MVILVIEYADVAYKKATDASRVEMMPRPIDAIIKDGIASVVVQAFMAEVIAWLPNPFKSESNAYPAMKRAENKKRFTSHTGMRRNVVAESVSGAAKIPIIIAFMFIGPALPLGRMSINASNIHNVKTIAFLTLCSGGVLRVFV